MTCEREALRDDLSCRYCLIVTLLPKDGYSEGTVCCLSLICQDWDVLYGENQCTITITFEEENLPHVRSKTTAMLIMLFDMDGLLYCEFLLEGHNMRTASVV